MKATIYYIDLNQRNWLYKHYFKNEFALVFLN